VALGASGFIANIVGIEAPSGGTLALIAVVILPLFIPPVVFGAGALERASNGLSPLPAFALLAAYVLFAGIIAPFAGAAAIRNAQS